MIWQNSVWIALQDIGVTAVAVAHDTYDLILCNDRVVVHLIPLDNGYGAEELIALQIVYQLQGVTLVQLWEDVWQTRQQQVLGRICSVLGLNKRLHGRKAVVKLIDQQQAADFLNENHIQGAARSKYKLALEIDGQLVAVACFSATRLMTRISPDYRSVELIRFATLIGYTVTGGFTKLLNHFIQLVSPDDIMSYADRDWSLGHAYELSGFKLAAITPPARILVNRDDMTRVFPHRLAAAVNNDPDAPDQNETALVHEEAYIAVFNTGNLKYIRSLN